MKYLTEFRDPEVAKGLLNEIQRTVTKPWVIMEVCGGQTHSIIRNGIDLLLPDEVELVHGPGCPVCVTPLYVIDQALEIAGLPDVIFCSFGDMLRVPGSEKDLFTVKSQGGDVRIVYSPLDAYKAGVPRAGFPPRSRPSSARRPTASRRSWPPVMSAASWGTGSTNRWSRSGRSRSSSPGSNPPMCWTGSCRPCANWRRVGRTSRTATRAVVRDGNEGAQKMLSDVFKVVDRNWRGIGEIPLSGWALSDDYAEFDAAQRFTVDHIQTKESSLCRSGEVLQGTLKPNECEAFGKECTPRSPLGATCPIPLRQFPNVVMGHGGGGKLSAELVHHAIVGAVTAVADQTRSRTGHHTVVLSGGVFANALLRRLLSDRLTVEDFVVLTHRLVPPNDGGLALGQIAVGARPGPT